MSPRKQVIVLLFGLYVRGCEPRFGPDSLAPALLRIRNSVKNRVRVTPIILRCF